VEAPPLDNGHDDDWSSSLVADGIPVGAHKFDTMGHRLHLRLCE